MYWDAAWASSLIIRRLGSVSWGTFGMEGAHGSTCWMCICEDVWPVLLAGLVGVGWEGEGGGFYGRLGVISIVARQSSRHRGIKLSGQEFSRCSAWFVTV